MDWKLDAAGRQKRWEEFGPYGANTYKGEQLYYDADGRDAKRGDLTKTRIGGVWGSWNEVPSYKLYSSVTGKEVQSLTSSGSHYRTHVYVDDMRIADERNGRGQIFIQEDVGNNAHLGKIWRYSIANDTLNLVAEHDSSRFITGAPDFLTQDEESSGIIDVSELLGEGWFLMDVQAHYSIAGELVEGGQLLALHYPPGNK